MTISFIGDKNRDLFARSVYNEHGVREASICSMPEPVIQNRNIVSDITCHWYCSLQVISKVYYLFLAYIDRRQV